MGDQRIELIGANLEVSFDFTAEVVSLVGWYGEQVRGGLMFNPVFSVFGCA